MISSAPISCELVHACKNFLYTLINHVCPFVCVSTLHGTSITVYDGGIECPMHMPGMHARVRQSWSRKSEDLGEKIIRRGIAFAK